MKKTLLSSAVFLLSGMMAIGQSTATNFTVSDCGGTSHTLFTELNAGKVIVMTWVMPCGACIAGASASSSKVQTYSSSNPGVVKFYLVDDAGDNSCSTLNSWASTNSIATDAVFSNSGTPINMSNYGTSGMPKTVVIGGPNHTVFLNKNGTPTASALQTAINSAIAAGTTGVFESNSVNTELKLFPNPAVNTAKVNYTLAETTVVSIDVINVLGQNVMAVSLGKQSAGIQEYQTNLESLNSGIYFVKLNAGAASETIKLTVSR